MSYFTERDRQLVEALEYDANGRPSYELMKGVLVWPDEVPEGLTSQGHESLGDLLVARAILFHERGRQTLNNAFYEAAWDQAQSDNLCWPGFHRLTLSPDDREYYEAAQADIEDF